MSHNAAAPDTIRTSVKLAGSIRLCARARRHSIEFPANASIATAVNPMMRAAGREVAADGAPCAIWPDDAALPLIVPFREPCGVLFIGSGLQLASKKLPPSFHEQQRAASFFAHVALALNNRAGAQQVRPTC